MEILKKPKEDVSLVNAQVAFHKDSCCGGRANNQKEFMK